MVNIEMSDVRLGTKVTLDKTPNREGYTFLGWSLDTEGTQIVKTVVINRDTIVYAQ